MDRRELIAAIASVAAVAQAPQALARFRGGAILDHAVPGVGLTVSGPVHEVRLYFDLGVIAAWSSVQVVNAGGLRLRRARRRTILPISRSWS
jgi:hypothetical protein